MFDEELELVLNANLDDITSKIYKTDEKYFYVRYENKKKEYKYNKNNVSYYSNPTILDHTKIIRTEHKILTNVSKALGFGKYVKIFFNNGSTKIYEFKKLQFETNLLSENKNKEIFNYLKELSGHLNISDIEHTNEYSSRKYSSNKKDGFLLKIYEKISMISQDSILNQYFAGKQDNVIDNLSNYIYPFSFNLSQKEAVNNAFNNSISIIEGPPGTGKTQTILNIIANAIVNGKTVAVVSNNNTATKNVYEKLQKNGVEGIAAQLGKYDNIKKFIEEQSKYEKCFFKEWIIDEDDEINNYAKLKSISEYTEDYLVKKNKIADNKNLLSKLKLEQKYFLNHLKENDIKRLENNSIKIPGFKADKLRSLLLFLNKFENNSNKFSKTVQLITEIHFLFNGHFMFENDIEEIMKTLEYNYYKRKISELEDEIKYIEQTMQELDLKEIFNEYTEISMKLFKSYVSRNFNTKHVYNDELIKNTKEFIKDYPVILSTTYSLVNCTSNDFLYDYIIVDESSQVDLVSSFPALMLGKKVVIVGDSKQLPNIVDSNRILEFEKIFNKYQLESKYNYAENSLLDLTKKIENVPIVILREHYRCHPKIIDFCNKTYYDNILIIHTESDDDSPIEHYLTVPGNHARFKNKSQYNDRQLQVIKQEIIPNENIDIDNDSVGIITPYKEQKKYIKAQFDSNNVEVDTVHGFQGNEKDIIIFSTVANNITKFLDNPNSLNVAISRAVKKLYLVTPNEYKSKKHVNLLSFIDYIKYQNFKVVDSKISSIFDLLYSVNKNKLDLFLQNYINKFNLKYSSEKLMHDLIDEVLNMPEFSNYELSKANYPLRNIFKDRSILNEREQNYISNNAHIDFMITTKNSHRIVVGIEVDSPKYHLRNEQLERDLLKNSIFKKYEIPLLRVGTEKESEKRDLIDILNSVNV